ncbi:uncharacterized protein [Montipora foliosa]|uniref:uncharacterized protein n=1 Tax=Montipora foliosa TaxID=591990 RepID=UPI0035F1BC25
MLYALASIVKKARQPSKDIKATMKEVEKKSIHEARFESRSGFLLVCDHVENMLQAEVVCSSNKMLTHEQKAILAKVIEGHNLVITGQGGTGKSYLIEQILHHLKRIGKEVAVVCSSGLSCTVYERGVAATVHSHYGMQTAYLPWKLVVERAGMDSLVVQRIKKANIVIWDEVSMSSARILEISNALEHYLSPQHAKMRPFGGKQFILGGDFFQLKPVPSLFDDGLYALSAKIYEVAFPHRFELTIIQRQSEADRKFLSLLRELRYWRCSDNSLNFVKSLERNLDAAVSERVSISFSRSSQS